MNLFFTLLKEIFWLIIKLFSQVLYHHRQLIAESQMSTVQVAAMDNQFAVMSSKLDWDFLELHQQPHRIIQDNNSNHNCHHPRQEHFCIRTFITNLHLWEICGTTGTFLQVSSIHSMCIQLINAEWKFKTVALFCYQQTWKKIVDKYLHRPSNDLTIR